MRTHDSNPERANVVAGFDSQWDAEEAVLELRLAGFRDDHMGYYASSRTGESADLLERNHWIIGSALGVIAGAALGVWLARVLPGWNLDPQGMMITCVTFGALFLGTIGGLIGMGIARRETAAPEEPGDSLVLALDAGDKQEQAWSIIRRHGGHQPVPMGA